MRHAVTVLRLVPHFLFLPSSAFKMNGIDDVSFTDSYGDDCQWYTDNEPRKSNQPYRFVNAKRSFFVFLTRFLFLLHKIHSFAAFFF
mmetsp:Transcript_17293/g.42224  ORF Transcript_17293/g.42224 Transcript_17293/m.42224 type:complete len:87 (+) Transcript_17293:334-594(+)